MGIKTKRLGMLSLLLVLVISSLAGFMIVAGSDSNSNVVVVPLIAGQYYVVGEVAVWTEVVDSSLYLHVRYSINDTDWYLTEAHLAVATSLSDIPKTKTGNPIPGRFPYKAEYLWDQSVEFTINLTDVFGLACPDSNETMLYVAAHAVVAKVDEYGNIVQRETAWGQGTRFTSRGNWGMYFTYTIICEECEEYCERVGAGSAWAYGNPFPGASWAMYVVYEGGTHETDLILGQHYDIGDVTIWREGDYLYVSIVMSSGYYPSVIHIHVATDLSGIPQTPSGNPKVGNFEYKVEFTEDVSEHTAMIQLDYAESMASTLYVAIHASIYTYNCTCVCN